MYEEGSFTLLARVESFGNAAQVYWYHTQLNDLPERMTDAQGETVWRGTFSAWGRTLVESGSGRWRGQQNLRFQGQYLDRETRLHYNTLRYYDAWGGCYTQVDPIGLLGGINLYSFVPNPLSWIDPLGLKCWNSARRSYWKAEAKAAPKGMYSSVNMIRMRLGLAPRIRVKEFHFKTGTERTRNVSLELNHRHWTQRDGKHVDIPYNLEKVTPWVHAAKDPYRHPGSELLEILQDIGNYKGF